MAGPHELYRQGRADLETAFGRDRDGGAYLSALSQLIDQLLLDLNREASPPAGVLAAATGGYGRRQLFPCSDIDLLFVYRDELTPEREAWVKELLHQLWDLDLRVGQQVWSNRQLKDSAEAPAEFLLSVLDARPILGDGRLFEELPRPEEEAGGLGQTILQGLVQLAEARHVDYGGTLYHLEPNLKEAPGALRDIQLLEWLQRLGVVDLTPAEQDCIDDARLLLSSLRVELHLKAGRNENRLDFRMQEAIASSWQLAGETLREQAEALMQQYFLRARPVFRLSRAGLARAAGRSAPAVSGPLTDEEVLDLTVEWLQAGVSLEGRLQGWVEPATAVDPAGVRTRLRRLLEPRPGLYEALSELYEVGFLERLLPEFTEIRALVIRDFYHRYTVDEHTLIAVQALERLLGPDCPDPRFRRLLREIDAPELLVLALLLHDVGKSREGPHSEHGAELAAAALRRFDFDAEDTAEVVYLVRHHLAMSQVMLKRDVEDREVLHRFATRQVSTPERLRLLTLLTYADVTAVGPATLTAWKRDLLWQLYVGTHRQLTIEYGAHRIAGEDLRDRLSGSLARSENQDAFRSFLKGFPMRYLETTEGDEIYRHFQMALRLKPGGVQSRLVQRRHHWELWVVASDQARLFSRIAGLLSYFEMNIVRARGFGNRQGIVLDSFIFEDPRGLFGGQPWEQERFRKQLEDLVSGRVSVKELLSRKEGNVVFPASREVFEPSVRFEEEAGVEETIAEIVAPDALGLLHRISQPMADLECDVRLALVSTAGDTAADVFYLSHRGAKLSPDLQQQLRRRILAALEEQTE